MCLGVVAKVVEANGPDALVDVGGVVREARLDLVPEVQVGQYVMLHAGFAISVLDEDYVAERQAMLDEIFGE